MGLKTYFLGDTVDHRSDNLFLMSTPNYSIIIGILYVICAKIIGPKFMHKRHAYNFQNTIIFYNAYQVIASAYIFYELGSNGWFTNYNWAGQSIDYSDSPSATRIHTISYLYHLSRYTELLDTFFFVARKKYNQVSLLHVSHHAVMPLFSYFGAKYGAGGSGTFPSFINSFIHIIMYTYYMIAAMGPKYQKYLTWKKHITVLQLIQFVVVLIHCLSVILIVDTNVPRICIFTYVGACVYFFVVFFLFFRSTYKAKHVISNGVENNVNNYAPESHTIHATSKVK